MRPPTCSSATLASALPDQHVPLSSPGVSPCHHSGFQFCISLWVCWMYSFPVAAVTNYHMFSGFNNTNVCSHHSGSQESEISVTGLKSGCYRAELPPRSRAAVPSLSWHQELVSWSPGFPWSVGQGWFGDDSSTLHLLCILFLLLLHQFHLRSSGIKSWKLGTPALGEKMFLVSSRVLWLQTFLEIMAMSLPCLPPWVHHSFFSLCVRFLSFFSL